MTPVRDEDASTVVGHYLEVWAAQDIAAILDLYHEDLTLVWPGDHDLAGRHEGRDAAATALLDLQGRTDRALSRVRRVVAEGDRADAWVTERWADDGTAVDVDRLLAFRVSGGQLIECEILESDQHLVDDWLATHPPG